MSTYIKILSESLNIIFTCYVDIESYFYRSWRLIIHTKVNGLAFTTINNKSSNKSSRYLPKWRNRAIVCRIPAFCKVYENYVLFISHYNVRRKCFCNVIQLGIINKYCDGQIISLFIWSLGKPVPKCLPRPHDLCIFSTSVVSETL